MLADGPDWQRARSASAPGLAAGPGGQPSQAAVVLATAATVTGRLRGPAPLAG